MILLVPVLCDMQKKVLFLLPYPLQRAPSQRFRIEAYFSLMQQQGIDFKVNTFLTEKAWDILYKKGSALQKALAVLQGFFKRCHAVLFVAPAYDYVLVHREASPLGPPMFEFILAKILRKKIIFDFDDAIWIPNTSAENGIVAWVKAFWKIKYICKWSYKIAAGNQYLANYALQFNRSVQLLPTCVDVTDKHNFLKEPSDSKRVVIGWTGSHSTMHYLDDVLPVLQKIVLNFDVSFLIISNKTPHFTLQNLQFIGWQESTEVADLARMDIGIMPLKADAWSEGKCGFKLIQYLALGIPAVACPVGVNKEIIEEGVNGFLCTTDGEWYDALKLLIQNATLRKEMGSSGRKRIVEHYSIQAQADTFLDLFS